MTADVLTWDAGLTTPCGKVTVVRHTYQVPPTSPMRPKHKLTRRDVIQTYFLRALFAGFFAAGFAAARTSAGATRSARSPSS